MTLVEQIAEFTTELGLYSEGGILFTRENHLKIARCIKFIFLSDSSIMELDENQQLPSFRNAVNKSYNDYMLGQEDMLKAGWKKEKK